ncbi:MAG: type IX secretion system sortase PorU [Bacteroidaceae bacterium]|nr:type IX secretion system sortase PorU [Bacteroidaceae bacterium]
MTRYILLFLLTLTLLPTKAQSEIEIDWTAYAQDTVAPVFTHNIDLGYGHNGHQYHVAIEYPELVPLTSEETTRYHLSQDKLLPEWPELDVYKGISAKRGQLDVSFIPIIWRDGKYWRIQNFVLKVEASPIPSQERELDTAMNRLSLHERGGEKISQLAKGRWVKIRVSDNGIHMLTPTQLKNMGFDDPSKVRLYGYGGHMLSESDTDSWIDDLCEVPLWRTDNQRLLFYARGSIQWTLDNDNTFTHTRNPYSDYGYYFLTADGEDEPMAFPCSNALAASSSEIVTTPAYDLHEIDDYAWFHGGRQLVESYDFAGGHRRQYRLEASSIVGIRNTATLDVCFSHNGKSSSSVSIAVDSSSLGNMTLSPIGSHSEASATTRSYKTALTPQSSNGDVMVTLTHNRSTGVSGRLDYLRLSYTSYIEPGKPIYATSTGTHTYVVEANKAAIWNDNWVVWRITDATAMEQIPLDKASNTFTAASTRGDIFIVVDEKATYPTPEEVGEITNQNLHATEPTDYIIIVPSSGKLTAQAERLSDVHRTRSGLRTKVVHADEVYNEFSSGTPDATAYRRYLKMLYDRAETMDEAPKYLLLFGDGAWDNRMLSPAWKGKSPDDYLLCFEAANSFSATSSYVMEDYFGLLDDGEGSRLLYDKVDIGVGRFPVTTTTQARDAVDKVVLYMDNADAGAWKNTILMLGDDGDNNQHMDDAERVARMLEAHYPDYMVKRIYWDTYPMEVTSTGNSYPSVRNRLLELLNEGALMVNYSGHGSPDVLSHELVISKNDMEQLSSPRLPVWVTVSCDITPFDNATMSFGEYAFLNPKGGAIGLMTSTRTTYSSQNRRINYLFSQYLFARDERGQRLRMGDAIRMAKCSLITSSSSSGLQDVSENKLNYMLMGDPALIIGNTDYTMVVDEVNGTTAHSNTDIVLKAGERVTVKGHLETLQGAPATDFTGVMHATVFDNIETITSRNNAGTAATPFTYYERTKTLFVGGDSVRNGSFTFTFRVPMDINYSLQSGLINLYAMSDSRDREAKGAYDSFLLGGTADGLVNDSLGPKVTLYLNTPDFITGDQVNETPQLFVALEDADGINTVGNGIGHDLVAIIDGKASMTYTLNDYYTSELGDYTRGSVTYSLPTLDEGTHTLMFRAWDMMNNATTVTVHFEVVEGLRPRILDITTSHSPAREHTTFLLTHDRPETEVSISIEVFDFSGRILWRHDEQAITPANNYSVGWDLITSSGQPLGTGVYLYRATVTSPTGTSASRVRKLTILR